MKLGPRFTLVEYGQPSDTQAEICNSSGLSSAEVRKLIDRAGRRIAAALGMTLSPLIWEHDKLRAIGVAGLIRVTPDIELEITPKFLGDARGDSIWRDDFFFLAMLSKHGRVLIGERLQTTPAAANSLTNLIVCSMIQMFHANSRRPLRTYRRCRELEFALDGDVDPETILLPTPDGFEQDFIRYDRRNIYNGTINAAIRMLLRETRDSSLRDQLARVSSELGAQRTVKQPRHQRLPSRARHWQDLFDISVDVLQGLSLSFESGVSAESPGYVVSTWRIWEDLLTIALRLGSSNSLVRSQTALPLGKRTQFFETDAASPTRSTELTVTPDIVVAYASNRNDRLVLDAKYKTRAGSARQRIDEADVYESLAFAQAANTRTVALIYPVGSTDVPRALGEVRLFETVNVGNVAIHGLQVEVRGISRIGGLREFATELWRGIEAALCISDEAFRCDQGLL